MAQNTTRSQVAQESFQNFSAPKMTAHRIQEDASTTACRTFHVSEIEGFRDRGVKPQMATISSPTLGPSSKRMASASDDIAFVDESLRSSEQGYILLRCSGIGSARRLDRSVFRGHAAVGKPQRRVHLQWPRLRPRTSSRWQLPAACADIALAILKASTELDPHQ